jgi:hypothetical protein
MKSNFFWDLTQCSPLEVNRRFGGTYRLHLQGLKISRARNQREIRWEAEFWFLARIIFRPWRWKRYVPPKRRLTLKELHCVISQKMVLQDNSVIHRSLFHPLATLRHRIWAGPEREREKKHFYKVSKKHDLKWRT